MRQTKKKKWIKLFRALLVSFVVLPVIIGGCGLSNRVSQESISDDISVESQLFSQLEIQLLIKVDKYVSKI